LDSFRAASKGKQKASGEKVMRPENRSLVVVEHADPLDVIAGPIILRPPGERLRSGRLDVRSKLLDGSGRGDASRRPVNRLLGPPLLASLPAEAAHELARLVDVGGVAGLEVHAHGSPGRLVHAPHRRSIAWIFYHAERNKAVAQASGPA